MIRTSPALALFLTFQGLFGLTASGRPWRVADEYEVYFQVQALADRGALDLDDMPPEVPFFGKVGEGQRRFAPYGPGIAFAALPHHALGRGLAGLAGIPRADRAWTVVVAAVTSLATTTWAALAVVGLFAAARAAGATERRALLLAGLLGAATFLWPHATVFFSEPVAAALAIWAAALVLHDRPGAAALLVCALVLVKGTNVILVPALVLLAWLGPGARRVAPEGRSRHAALLVAVGGVAALLVHAGWNEHRFGRASEVGYDWGEMLAPGGPAAPFALSALPRGLFGLLLSPGKSLLLFAPPLLLLAWARPDRRVAPKARMGHIGLVALVAMGGSLLFYGAYMYWEGGYCFGPRHLLPALPLALLPLVRARPPAAAVRAALCAGAVVGFLGTTVSFLEDQAMGETARHGEARQTYYLRVDDAPPGRPRNVYRMGYLPWTSYPRLLAEGRAVESARLHLERTRSLGAPIPAWVPWAVSLPFALPLLLGLHAVRARAGSRR